ncbi:MAG: cation:proton antiporter [Chloroflexi bacterium]|nr:cation:proton antiporter [Chloroflexota bacterium]
MITIGALTTWLLTTLAAHFVLGLEFDMSVLLGAILVVSGPTVVIPLLRHVRPIGQVGPIMKWEGIVIDPLGAMLAVLVFGLIVAGRLEDATTLVIVGFLKTIFIGGFAGVIGAVLLLFALRRYWIPDFLQSTVALMMVFTVYGVSDLFQSESGLLGVTIMGIIMGNQKRISVRHIIEFKENLGVLLVSGLFILLAARLESSDFSGLSWGSLAFLIILILVVRPVAVILSTIKSGLNWREKLFLMWMAPRGIVAAAVASVFALRLLDTEVNHPEADELVPATFLVIIGTVTFYGLTVFPLARRLQIAQPNPQGFLIMGAHSWAREIAKTLQAKGYQVLLVDTDWENLSAARAAGLPTFYASILSQYALDKIDLSGIGYLLALTPNNGANSLAALHFAPFLGRANVFQLPPEESGEGRKEAVSHHIRGRLLFGPGITYSYLSRRFNTGSTMKATGLTEKFDHDDFDRLYGNTAVPLFLITETGNLAVFAADSQISPRPGDTLIGLVDPVDETANGKEN